MAVYKFTNVSGKRRSFSTPVNRVLNINEAVTLDVSVVDLGGDIAKEASAGFLLVERISDETPDNMELAVASMVTGTAVADGFVTVVRNYDMPLGENHRLTVTMPLTPGTWEVTVCWEAQEVSDVGDGGVISLDGTSLSQGLVALDQFAQTQALLNTNPWVTQSMPTMSEDIQPQISVYVPVSGHSRYRYQGTLTTIGAPAVDPVLVVEVLSLNNGDPETHFILHFLYVKAKFVAVGNGPFTSGPLEQPEG